MNTDPVIDELLKEAKHCHDPERLWQIRDRLLEYGAWEAVRRVEQMANTAERARDRAMAVRA